MDAELVDLEGDGVLELITANFDDLAGQRAGAPYRVYANDAGGRSTKATTDYMPATALGNGLDVEAADLDADGLVDLYLASRGGTDRLLAGALRDRPGPFRRGDPNGDRAINLTDPISILNGLFLVPGTLSCLDAADTNDDGDVNLSDAVYELNFLFLGGRPPPAPGTESCGRDPTADELECDESCAE